MDGFWLLLVMWHSDGLFNENKIVLQLIKQIFFNEGKELHWKNMFFLLLPSFFPFLLPLLHSWDPRNENRPPGQYNWCHHSHQNYKIMSKRLYWRRRGWNSFLFLLFFHFLPVLFPQIFFPFQLIFLMINQHHQYNSAPHSIDTGGGRSAGAEAALVVVIGFLNGVFSHDSSRIQSYIYGNKEE